MIKILVLCTANICRSPMAQRLLSRALQDYEVIVNSAGLQADYGHRMDATVKELLQADGFEELDEHVSEPYVKHMAQSHDLFLVMEQHHLDSLQRVAPEVTGRAYLIGHWSGSEIADPVNQDRVYYEEAYQKIAKGVQEWKQKLKELEWLN